MFPRTNTCFGQNTYGAAPLEGMYGIFKLEVKLACLPVWEQHVLFVLEGDGLPEAAEGAVGQCCPGHMG